MSYSTAVTNMSTPSTGTTSSSSPAQTPFTVRYHSNTSITYATQRLMMPLYTDQPPTNANGVTDIASFVIYLFTLGLFWLPTIITNWLVCVVIRRSRRLQSTTNYFVMSLSTSDLVLSLIFLPLFVATLPHFADDVALLNTGTCKSLALLEHLLPASVMFVFVCILVDRFYTIIYPLSFKVTRGRAKRLILSSWGVALVLSLAFPFLYDVETADVTGDVRCLGRQKSSADWTIVVFALVFFVAVYVIPTLLLTYGYTRVFRYIWRIDGSWRFQRTTHAVTPAKAAMVKLIISVTAASLLLLWPFGVIQLLGDLSSDVHASVEGQAARWTVVWVYCASAGAKPAFYLVGNANFRRGSREVMCCWSSRCYRRSAYAITKASIFSRAHHVGIVDASNAVTSPTGNTTSRESPSRAFNRASKLVTSNWPLSVRDGISSTYI
jgi:G protein-coupled receptor 19